MNKHEITPKQLLEIIEARRNNTNPNIDRRLYALQLRGEGMKNVGISEKLNITPFAVCRWVRRAAEHGVQSFLVNPRKQKNLKITSEQRIEIINALKNNSDSDVDKRLLAILLRSDGMSGVEIAKKFNVSSAAVLLWVNKFRKCGVSPLLTVKANPLELTPQQHREIIEARKNTTTPKIDRYLHAILLRSEGVTSAEIAKKFNVSLPCIYKWIGIFKKHGVRPHSINKSGRPKKVSYIKQRG